MKLMHNHVSPIPNIKFKLPFTIPKQQKKMEHIHLMQTLGFSQFPSQLLFGILCVSSQLTETRFLPFCKDLPAFQFAPHNFFSLAVIFKKTNGQSYNIKCMVMLPAFQLGKFLTNICIFIPKQHLLEYSPHTPSVILLCSIMLL